MFGFGTRKSTSSTTNAVANSGVVVGYGMLWKQGTSYKSWKHRRYEIHDNAQFFYLDITTSPSTIKGSIDIGNVFIRDGPAEFATQCGNMPQSIANKRVPITMESKIDGRELEIVFDTVEDVYQFLVAVYTVSMHNNVIEFAKSKGYNLPKIGAGLSTPTAKPSTSESSALDNSSLQRNASTGGTSGASSGTGVAATTGNSGSGNSSRSASSTTRIAPISHADSALSSTSTPHTSEASQSRNNGSTVNDVTSIVAANIGDTHQATKPGLVTESNSTLSKSPDVEARKPPIEHLVSTPISSEDIISATRSPLPSVDRSESSDPFNGRVSISEMTQKGAFWKKPSSRLGGWKYRYYMITPGAQLLYFEDVELMTVKGTLDLTNVELSDGSAENCSHCTPSKAATPASVKVPVNLTVSTPDNGHRTMEVVFESPGDFVTFVYGIVRTSTKHNIKEFETAHKMVALAAGAPYQPDPSSQPPNTAANAAGNRRSSSYFAMFSSSSSSDGLNRSQSSVAASSEPVVSSTATSVSTVISSHISDLSVLSSDSKVIEGRFLKMGHIVKNWKSRRYVIVQRCLDPTSTGASSSPAGSGRRMSKDLTTLSAPLRVPLLLYFEKDSDTVARGVLALNEVKFSLDDANIARSMATNNSSLLVDGVTFTIWAVVDLDAACRDVIRHHEAQTSLKTASTAESAFKFKELLLVFPKLNEAVRFVQCVASTAFRSNGQWFLDTVLLPSGSCENSTAADSVSSRLLRANTGAPIQSPAHLVSALDIVDDDSTSVLTRRSKITADSLVKRGVVLKLKVTGKMLKTWRSRWYEIHTNPEDPTEGGTFSYQSETFAAGNAIHLKTKSVAGCKLIVSLVEIKASIEDPSAFVADPSACSVVPPDISIYSIALRLHFAPKDVSVDKMTSISGPDFTANDFYCLCIPREYYDGSIPTPVSPAQGGAEWEDKTDAATFVCMTEFLLAVKLVTPDSNIEDFLQRLQVHGSIRKLFANKSFVTATTEAVLEKPQFDIPQNTIYRLASCVWVIWMFHTSFFPTTLRIFFFCAGTCALVYFFRYIAAGLPVSGAWDAFKEYLVENRKIAEEVIVKIRERRSLSQPGTASTTSAGNSIGVPNESTTMSALTSAESKKTN